MDIREDETSFYILSEDGKRRIAEITFVYTGDNLAIIDHTVVNNSLRGQKVGNKLVAAVAEKIRVKPGKLFRFVRLPKVCLIKPGSMTISATPGNTLFVRGNCFSPHRNG